ncbi:MAG: Fic family protein [Rhodoblastus sp.]|nr:Fic family protein [Rhodoblastus sp.]
MFQPNFRITPKITSALMQIEACRQAINDLPIDTTVLRHLRETAALVTTHFSTQIEGNRLTLPEVRAAIKGEKLPGRERDEREVRNHFRALEEMERLAERPGDVMEADLRRLHGLVMTGRDKPSPYRLVQNVIRDGSTNGIVYLPPEAHDVPDLMRALVEWINAELTDGELPAPIVAALAHYQFATVHPYLDGNGRTARLLATLILRKAGYGLKGIYSLDEHYAKNLPAYYSALTVGTHNYYDGRAEGDVTPFVSYFCAGMADAFTKVRSAAARAGKEATSDQSAVLRDLDPRQRRLLELFRKQGSATAAEMAAHLKMSPRTLVSLCRDWIASGFLEYQSAARKNRSYRLGERFHQLNT